MAFQFVNKVILCRSARDISLVYCSRASECCSQMLQCGASYLSFVWIARHLYVTRYTADRERQGRGSLHYFRVFCPRGLGRAARNLGGAPERRSSDCSRPADLPCEFLPLHVKRFKFPMPCHCFQAIHKLRQSAGHAGDGGIEHTSPRLGYEERPCPLNRRPRSIPYLDQDHRLWAGTTWEGGVE